MTCDEWDQVLAAEPATPNQVGAIIGEFDRLGVVDRPERLAISAVLLGLDDLGSTTDLVMGQAGKLIATLREIRDRGELPGVTAAAVDDDQADDPGHLTLIEAIQAVILAFLPAGKPVDVRTYQRWPDRL